MKVRSGRDYNLIEWSEPEGLSEIRTIPFHGSSTAQPSIKCIQRKRASVLGVDVEAERSSPSREISTEAPRSEFAVTGACGIG